MARNIPPPRRLGQHQRDRYDIVNDILSIVANTQPLYRNRRNQTSIGYAANLTHPQTVRFLKGLIDEGLLVFTESRPSSFYEITTEGQRYLQVFAELQQEMKREGDVKYSCFI
jgi:predicted transcriptional regulator